MRLPATLRPGIVVAALAFAMAVLAPAPVAARTSPDALPEVALADLPPEVSEVNALIRTGGPFRYERDGIVFGNRERLLPAKPRGYYHEYTVPTPGVKSRGARRIICGGKTTAPDACWYTTDHYQTYRRIRE